MTAHAPASHANDGQRRDWHFSTGNTHLYPGSTLRLRSDIAGAAGPRRGDTLRVEFVDLGFALGRIAAVRADGFDAAMRAHTTARGTLVAARTWRIAYATEAGPAGGCKVRQRMDLR